MKRRRINTIINKGKATIFFIQEIKIKDFQEFYAKILWVNSKVGYSFSNSPGLSGGIVTLGNKEKLEVSLSFRGEGFLRIKVNWKDDWYYVINVYSSCDLEKKKSYCMIYWS